MNRENNVYTILYASIMVIIVAVALAFTHQSLSEQQTKNVNIDKMQQILRSLHINASTNEAESKYNELIKNSYLVTPQGEKVEGSEGTKTSDPAFATDIAVDASKGLPVFEAEIEGRTIYILPMSGKGLWGPIWGYIAIESDGSTVYGADFSHQGETPGLGAEIATPQFGGQFDGKHLFRDNTFTSIAVVKPGQSVSDRDYVDGISGGTITSKGVNAMLLESVGQYKNFLMNLNAAKK
ncbi:NADH:ubiquinone reductase (Na(+)-transporting) subunit C [Seramator thermalis]|jgi:Na+-transporting NADH:ubiquinone oxidoreductase subunit C|uniref:NADH:ubiquinone reductase (Na(+)-transporting) subunit C n=1 Tax=Seramator thermalis TaxID=2496270 RepID=UPI00101D2895|nr:NADH:ubiquinone reductase (Na(+)-transporting) subunit C [Seramator thermalis]